MSHAEIISELRASRRWVLIMAGLAFFFCSLWCLLAAAGWIEFLMGVPFMPQEKTAWVKVLQAGFAVQLSLLAFASPIPFVTLWRYAKSLGQLKENDVAGLQRSLELSRTFWRRACYLGWGSAWLLVYLFGGGTLGLLIWGK